MSMIKESPLQHDMFYAGKWVERFMPLIPAWHRGLCWDEQTQIKFARSWLMGEVDINVVIGRPHIKMRDDTTGTVWVDGLNSFHSCRLALQGAIIVEDYGNDSEKPMVEWLKVQGMARRHFRAASYYGPDDWLARQTYLLNRGSPLPWTKDQLPR